MRDALIIVAALALPQTASAQDVDCNNINNYFAARECSGRAADQSDGELNHVWRQIKPLADREGWGDALLNEQRAWLVTRDRRCDLEFQSVGNGSFAMVVYANCITKMTQARTAMLRALF